MILAEPLLGDHRTRSRGILAARIAAGISAAELPPDTDVDVLVNYVTVVLTGMSAQARDGATREDLLSVAEAAMRAWPAGDGTAPP
jgi:hypothetical protein